MQRGVNPGCRPLSEVCITMEKQDHPRSRTIKRIAAGLLLLVVAAGIAGAAWWWRPWSAYSPARTLAMLVPGNRVTNFRHLDRFMPYRRIAAAAPVALPRQPGHRPVAFRWAGGTGTIDSFVRDTKIMGLMVVKNGVVVEERYALGSTSADHFTSWSMAKSVLSTLVGIAMREGKIRSLDDKASDYVPSLAGTAYGNTRLRDLLRMSSGIAWDDNFRNSNSDITHLYEHAFVFDGRISEFVARFGRARPEGTHFHYISSDPQILSEVLRSAVGEPVSDYLSQKLWQPLGMRAGAYWNTDFDGEELAFCCLNATLEDFAKFGVFVDRNGQWNGVQILPPDWLHDATSVSAPYLKAGPRGTGKPSGYGYLWWLPEGTDGEMFANGIFGQTIWINRSRHIVIVIMSADGEDDRHAGETTALIHAITQAYE